MIRGAWTKLRAKLTTSMRQGVVAGLILVLLMLSIPRPAQAQFGIDLALIIAGLKQINSLLTSQVAAPLQQIQKIESEYTKFQQEVKRHSFTLCQTSGCQASAPKRACGSMPPGSWRFATSRRCRWRCWGFFLATKQPPSGSSRTELTSAR